MSLAAEPICSKAGVTHAIRKRLNFLDERHWKRFSARRLELIDTLDLSSKKASEQEHQIRDVAEILRLEYDYSSDYADDFNKLVRAAVQSVRRNRKRVSKSKKFDVERGSKEQERKISIINSSLEGISGASSESSLYFNSNDRASSTSNKLGDSFTDSLKSGDNLAYDDKLLEIMVPKKSKFLSEISKLNSDSQDDLYDLNYSRSKNFSALDRSREAIGSMLEPKINNHTAPFASTKLPPITNLSAFKPSSFTNLKNVNAKSLILNYIERSKTCAASTRKSTENIAALGRAFISASIAYTLETSLENLSVSSAEYLRLKLELKESIAKIFRELDVEKNCLLSDDISTVSFSTLLGGCVKDFGFDLIMTPFCELLFVTILHDYPLISKPEYINDRGLSHSMVTESFNSGSLRSLAAVATDIQKSEQRSTKLPDQVAAQRDSTPSSPTIENDASSVGKKKVTLRFLSSVLEFYYQIKNSAPPRYLEILENARSAFNLSLNDVVLTIRNSADGLIVNTDGDLEKIFTSQDDIELEILAHGSSTISVSKIASAVQPNDYQNDPPRIILPHPYHNPVVARNQPRNGTNDKPNQPMNFLSNQDDAYPPSKRFQPLL